MVADAHAGEVDASVDPLQATSIDASCCRAPLRVLRAGPAPHEPGDPVAGPLQRRNQRAADEAVRPADEYAPHLTRARSGQPITTWDGVRIIAPMIPQRERSPVAYALPRGRPLAARGSGHRPVRRNVTGTVRNSTRTSVHNESSCRYRMSRSTPS